MEAVAAPVPGVAAIGHLELIFVPCELEGSGEVFVGEGPVAEEIVEVVLPFLDRRSRAPGRLRPFSRNRSRP